MSDETVTLKDKRLKDLIKAFKNPPTARVGILGNKNARSSSGKKTNSEIGALHEFGTSEIPQRSFLRIPIIENLEKFLEKNGAFDRNLLAKVIEQKSLELYVHQIAVTAEEVVQEAFASGGFGKWPAHKSGYQNNTGMLLIDTTQLRNSITSEVKKSGGAE